VSKCRCGMFVPESVWKCLNCERKRPGGPTFRRVVTATGIKEVLVPVDDGYTMTATVTTRRLSRRAGMARPALAATA